MIFEIRPYNGVGQLLFGMTRDEVREKLKRPYEQFRRGNRGNEIDYFKDVGIFANYDDRGRLEFVEFASPAQPTLFGVDLFGIGSKAAEQYLQLLGSDLTEADESSQSRRLGVELWIPDPEEPDKPAESVLVAGPDYYKD